MGQWGNGAMGQWGNGARGNGAMGPPMLYVLVDPNPNVDLATRNMVPDQISRATYVGEYVRNPETP